MAREHSERFNKELENIQKTWLWMKNLIIEIKKHNRRNK